MKKCLSFFVFGLLILTINYLFGQERPKMPYVAKGACPFEGCTYREWKTHKELIVYQNERNKKLVAFKLKSDESFTAITGNVHILKYGIAVALKPFTINRNDDRDGYSEAQVKKNEKIYMLDYEGEGVYNCWFKGKFWDISTVLWSLEKENNDGREYEAQIINLPTQEWWVNIKDQQGRIGWILMNDDVDIEGNDLLGTINKMPSQDLSEKCFERFNLKSKRYY